MYRIETNITANETGKYGKSLFALRDFVKGEVVFVAYGPIVKEPTIYTIPIDWGLFIDPTLPEDNLSQYICHSCEPNLGVRARSIFVAMRDIQEGEEVTIDYAMIVPEYGEKFADVEASCKCGKPACRGKLGSYYGLSDELKSRYKGYISEYLLTEMHAN